MSTVIGLGTSRPGWPLEGHMAIHIRRREFIVALGGVATARAALTVSGPALGQDYPNRQIITLVGIAAGGITDVTTRQYAALLSKNLDQNVIVENRPVAGGAVAAAVMTTKLVRGAES
jgi:tripartite-type tricarboxylate transporter receptor subunit TctC